MTPSPKTNGPNSSEGAHNPPRRKTRVLIVDDYESILEVFSQVLIKGGFDVLAVTDGAQALKAVLEWKPDLVVLDVGLPDISGIDVCQRIKADPKSRDVFVILISGEAISADQTAGGLAIGADEYLHKPVAAKEFLARVRSIARLAETAAALRESEQHYRRLVQILPDSIATIDPEFRVSGLNQWTAVMLGYGNIDELHLKSIFDFVHPTDRDRFRADISSFKTGEVKAAEYQFVRRDGRSFPVETNITMSLSPGGENLGLIMAARDVTDHKRLEEKLRGLPRRITEAQEAERSRVARELHDGVIQVIAAATMRLRRVHELVGAQNPVAAEILSRCQLLLVQALDENRRIARNLRPGDLDELGLSAACRNLCNELESRTRLVVKYRFVQNGSTLPPNIDLGLFRVVQEALNNIEKHAKAKLVRVRIVVEANEVRASIRDDGCGFDTTAAESSDGDRRRGIGLSSIRERTSALGGTCAFVSKPNEGTAITVRIPLADRKPRQGVA